MRRVDRLLLKIREAERLDALHLSVAFIERKEEGGSWTVIADLWDGVPSGRTQRLTMECDTLEEAQKAVDEIEEVHTPTGKRANAGASSVCIINDLPLME